MLENIYTKTFLIMILIGLSPAGLSRGEQSLISDDSAACIACHQSINPGIVGDWRKSLHAATTPSIALKKATLEKLVSSPEIPEDYKQYAVGCAECHMANPDTHKDTFEHNGFQIHSVVTPEDCSICHKDEADQYGENLMSHACSNLQGNNLYSSLMDSINGKISFKDMKISALPSEAEADGDSCLSCHGTRVQIKGTRTTDTVYGEMTFPVLTGWPNQGAGRINPDGSTGACTACHARHQFNIETARKPETCSECHTGPDVPAYGVYSVSKHGNRYFSQNSSWNFLNVPWTVGKDFNAPTCAVCHISLLVSEDGKVINERTHRMNNRLPLRIFGLVYSHNHPGSPDTTTIKNKAGMPLPTELSGEVAAEFLIDNTEKEKRLTEMQKTCLACHAHGWVNSHFDRFHNTVKAADEMTLTATKILMSAWEQGLARGFAQGDSIFNEPIEKQWIEQWLFYANSTRFASAMGGADYGVFSNGRYYMSKNISDMFEWMNVHHKKNEK